MLPPYYPVPLPVSRRAGIRLTCLGTGSPEPSVFRASSGFLAEIGQDKILLDCGGGTFDRLLQAGFRPGDVTRLFFSHMHSDHMMDYARLIHAAWDAGAPPLKVFGPAPLREINEKLFGRNGAFARDLTARAEHPASQAVWKARGGALPREWPAPEVTEITPGDSCDGAEWQMTSCPVAHAQPFLESAAFRLESSDGATLAYSGDAALSKEWEALMTSADLLLHWCFRFSDDSAASELADMTPTPRDIAAMAARAGVRRLMLTHLRPDMDAPGRRAKALTEMREEFSGTIGIAEDLMRADITPLRADSSPS